MHDPRVPETLEGWSVLHQMFRVDWEKWTQLAADERGRRAAEAAQALDVMAQADAGATAVTTLLGHKGDLMLVHFRRSFEALQEAQLRVARLALSRALEPTSSYVSIVELGMYEMTGIIHGRLAEQGLKNGTPEFDQAFAAELEEQRRRVAGRLFQEIPARRHVCFYPMNKRRGEAKNWYAVPFEERGRMMRDHGVVGRNYAGQVTQIISGSIGFDDWEWGVTLFADDPLVFKKLIYEMRFDEASAWYAEFGPFYVGLRFSPSELPRFLDGELPAFRPPT
jgi:chlorite dismutase